MQITFQGRGGPKHWKIYKQSSRMSSKMNRTGRKIRCFTSPVRKTRNIPISLLTWLTGSTQSDLPNRTQPRRKERLPTQGSPLHYYPWNSIQARSRRTTQKMPGEKGTEASHESLAFRSLRGTLCCQHHCQPDPVARLLVAAFGPRRQIICR